MLNIEIFHRGAWHDAATLTLPEPDKGLSGPAQLEYDQMYALYWMLRDGFEACSLTLPEISLAPVYDFAPMKLDPEGVVRTTKWGSPWEEGGAMNWQSICQELADLVAPEQLLTELRSLAQKLIGLRERLAARGVPADLLDRPALGLNHLDDRLQSWHLI